MQKEIKMPTYDYVGHITYPCTDSIKKIFFQKDVKKTICIVSKDGKIIASERLIPEFARYLDDLGYQITYTNVPAPEINKPIPKFTVDCKNKECLYAKEKYRGMCKIPTKAVFEHVRQKIPCSGGKKKIVETRIVVTFTARDITELTKKSDCILSNVFQKCQIMGEPDVYGKMEFC